MGADERGAQGRGGTLMGGFSLRANGSRSATREQVLGRIQGEEGFGVVAGVIRDSGYLPLVSTFSSMDAIGTSFSHIFKGDGAFHIFPRKYSLVLPFHEDLDVGRHDGQSVSMWAVGLLCGRSLRGLERGESRGAQRTRCQ